MLINLPNVLLLQIAQEFLVSRDVVSLAASSSFSLRVLRASYRRSELMVYCILIEEDEDKDEDNINNNCISVLNRYPSEPGFSLSESRITCLPLRRVVRAGDVKVPMKSTSSGASAKKEVVVSTSSSSFSLRSRYCIGLPTEVEIELVRMPEMKKDDDQDQMNEQEAEEVEEEEKKKKEEAGNDVIDENVRGGEEDKKEEKEKKKEKEKDGATTTTTTTAHEIAIIREQEDTEEEEQKDHQEEEEEEEVDDDRENDVDREVDDDDEEEKEEDEEEDGQEEKENDVFGSDPDNKQADEDCYELAHLDFLPSTVTSLVVRTQLISPPIASFAHQLPNLKTLILCDTYPSHFQTSASDWPPHLYHLTLFTRSCTIHLDQRIEPELHLSESIQDVCISMKHFKVVPSTEDHHPIIPSNVHTSGLLQWPNTINLYNLNSVPLARCHLPDTIESLVLEKEYNGRITHLPGSLTELHFDFWSKFNNSSLSEMSSGSWPQNLTSLRFGGHFDEDISNMRLPATVTFLSLGHVFNQSLMNFQFPSSLKTFQLSNCWNQPNELSHLSANLPSTLETLEIGVQFSHTLNGLTLPPRLTRLALGCAANEPLSKMLTFPETLTSLDLSHIYNQPSHDLVLPSQLRELYFGRDWNQSLHSLHLPDTLTSVHFSHAFDQPLTDIKLPHSLRTLNLGASFSHPLSSGSLPSSLTALQLSNRSYSHPLFECVISLPLLTHLILSRSYVHGPTLDNLPESIFIPCRHKWPVLNSVATPAAAAVAHLH